MSINTSHNSSEVVYPTNDFGGISNKTFSLMLYFSAQQAQQAMVDIGRMSTRVADLDSCSNTEFYFGGPNNVTSSSIPFLSCDGDYASIKESLEHSVEAGASCVVFYSEIQDGCAFNKKNHRGYQDIPNVFTMLNRGNTLQLAGLLAAKQVIEGTIVTDGTTMGQDDGPSSSLIGLYVVVAVLGAIIILVILAGVVRYTRYPELYRPQGIEEENRHTQARGLARAVVDAIPLVRVANRRQEDVESTPDIEPKGAVEIDGEQFFDTTSTIRHEEELGDDGIDLCPVEADDLCPICFDEYRPGEVLRNLPCKHKFHATCVDPWLLKESSECPLCRIDLALVQDPETEPMEVINPRFRGRPRYNWRKLVRIRRRQLEQS